MHPGFKHAEAREYRDAARDAWAKSDGSIEAAEVAFLADPRIAKLDPMTLIAIFQIVFKLWAWWASQKVSEPSVAAHSDEPFFDSGDEE